MCALLRRWNHPDEMFEELTLPQYADWVAYLRRYNLFPDRADVQWGLLTAAVMNQWAARGESVRPCDVMPYHDPLEQEITADELARRVMAAAE